MRDRSLSETPTSTPTPTNAHTMGESQVNLPESEQFCRQLARSHYENFIVASVLLPRRLQQPFYNIYAFCRTADDVADESPTPQHALEGLRTLQQNVDAVFAGQIPPSGLFPALADTIAKFRLSKTHFDDLLSAFRQDQHLTHYETTSELIDYCSRSANPVGRMVLELADSLDETTQPLSDSICTGLQLANFWQDVARDLQIGRIYLPADARSQFGVTDQMLQQPHSPPELKSLLAKLCDDAEALFRRGLPLANHVPTWLASDVKLFAHGGLATLDAIRKVDYDVLRSRPKVSKTKQLSLMVRAALRML